MLYFRVRNRCLYTTDFIHAKSVLIPGIKSYGGHGSVTTCFYVHQSPLWCTQYQIRTYRELLDIFFFFFNFVAVCRLILN
jgi:hypothetical protein